MSTQRLDTHRHLFPWRRICRGPSCVHNVVVCPFSCFSTGRVYSCRDARFYDDETLTVVLGASEEEEGSGRVLAQLPLGPALSRQEDFSWDPSLRCHKHTPLVLLTPLLESPPWTV